MIRHALAYGGWQGPGYPPQAELREMLDRYKRDLETGKYYQLLLEQKGALEKQLDTWNKTYFDHHKREFEKMDRIIQVMTTTVFRKR